jgi:hypothetical protein
MEESLIYARLDRRDDLGAQQVLRFVFAGVVQPRHTRAIMVARPSFVGSVGDLSRFLGSGMVSLVPAETGRQSSRPWPALIRQWSREGTDEINLQCCSPSDAPPSSTRILRRSTRPAAGRKNDHLPGLVTHPVEVDRAKDDIDRALLVFGGQRHRRAGSVSSISM